MTSIPLTRQAPRTPRRLLTQQRLDPLGALAAWPLAPVVALIVVAYTATTTVLQAGQIQHPLLSVLAIVASVAAAGTLVAASRPDHAPFDRPLHLVMVGLAVSAHLLDQAARWGHNTLIQDDFGPLCIGLLLLALAPYRPWREIALSGTVAAVIVAAVTVPQAPFLSIAVPAVIYAIVAVSQVLAPALAGAAYSRRIVRLLLTWQTDARRAISARTEESRGQVVRAIVEQQWASLGAGVFPLLTGVLDHGEVTRADIARAGELAGALRKELLRDIDKTWLDAAVDRERASLLERGATPLLVVADPEHRATAFTADQRAAIAALIGALCAVSGFDPCSLVVQVADGTDARRRPLLDRFGELTAGVGTARDKPGRAPRSLTLATGPTAMAAGSGSTAKGPTATARGASSVAATTGAITTATGSIGTVAEPAARERRVATVTIQVGIDLSERRLRRVLRPYLGVLRVVFGRVRVSMRRPLLMLEFDDERGPTSIRRGLGTAR
ncbi:hypothetical protein RCH16_000072 [Cryobacterium sp. MP_M5]|uniref:hypothetical protein n=1 Tax=unclassified Cryobacterium TaxID=2649013 RepID=UPI0018CA1264|nr:MULTISPECIES: hypothetical protein [unclassified Cryobacterium]MBG6056886.1 hypothetical protein [Cryobacterium sp. MP_M3]MEC5175085.1 hypothetical protein [Cryobacterium sp. MP_M5]